MFDGTVKHENDETHNKILACNWTKDGITHIVLRFQSIHRATADSSDTDFNMMTCRMKSKYIGDNNRQVSVSASVFVLIIHTFPRHARFVYIYLCILTLNRCRSTVCLIFSLRFPYKMYYFFFARRSSSFHRVRAHTHIRSFTLTRFPCVYFFLFIAFILVMKMMLKLWKLFLLITIFFGPLLDIISPFKNVIAFCLYKRFVYVSRVISESDSLWFHFIGSILMCAAIWFDTVILSSIFAWEIWGERVCALAKFALIMICRNLHAWHCSIISHWDDVRPKSC